MVRPSSSGAISRRVTSTSGSSGISDAYPIRKTTARPRRLRLEHDARVVVAGDRLGRDTMTETGRTSLNRRADCRTLSLGRARVARIVLIDDDDGIRELYAEFLSTAGHVVLEAGSGLAGIEVVRRERPDLVICDIHMPDMDGYRVLEAVRSDPALPSVPF